MKIVILSQPECLIAKFIGRRRREISLEYARQSRHDFTPDGVRNDIESTAAEMAVAKLLNVYPEWSPTPGEVPRFDLRWLGRRIDVKSTRLQDGNLLIPSLNEELIYFLVRGTIPRYRIIGYLQGERVPWAGQWREDLGHGSCWFVPASQLQDLTNCRR